MSEQPANNIRSEEKSKKLSKSTITAIIAGAILLIAVFVFAIVSLTGGKNVEDIENLPELIELAYEEQFQLEPVIVPEKAAGEITYSIDDARYATVDENGLITAKAVQGSTFVTVEVKEFSKKIKMDIYAPVDAEALEESYKSAKSLLDIVNSDTSINQDDVAEAKNNMQQSFDILESKGIKIEDISELGLSVLASLESKDVVASKNQALMDAYEYAWDIVEKNQAEAAAAAAVAKKKTTKKTQKSTVASTASSASNHAYCSVCGSTAHTKHPSCVVCGSTSHSKHPVCPICASTTHTKHPQ